MLGRSLLAAVSALALIAVCSMSLVSAAAVPQDSQSVSAIVPDAPPDDLASSMVSFGIVTQALQLLTATIDELALQGELTMAAQERLALLIGGITGQLTTEAQEYVPEDNAFQNIDDFGQGGPAPDKNVYHSQILPSRHIIISAPASAASPDGEAGKELSVYIDDTCNMFVLGDPSAPDSMQQLSLKQGWEKDYDKLSGQIEQMLAEFMKQHATEQPPADNANPQPGTAI